MVDIDEIHPIQSSEFIESLNIGSALRKKTARKTYHFSLKD